MMFRWFRQWSDDMELQDAFQRIGDDEERMAYLRSLPPDRLARLLARALSHKGLRTRETTADDGPRAVFAQDGRVRMGFVVPRPSDGFRFEVPVLSPQDAVQALFLVIPVMSLPQAERSAFDGIDIVYGRNLLRLVDRDVRDVSYLF